MPGARWSLIFVGPQHGTGFTSLIGRREFLDDSQSCRKCLHVSMMVLANRVPSKIFGPKREEVTGDWRKLRNEYLYIFSSSPNIWLSTEEESGQRGMQHVWRRANGRTEFWWVNLKARDHLEDLGVDVNIILKRIFKKFQGRACTVFMWPWLGTSGGLL